MNMILSADGRSEPVNLPSGLSKGQNFNKTHGDISMRLKKTRSRALDVGLIRTTGLQEIDQLIEFTDGFTTEAYNELVFETLQELQKYNAAIKRADKQKRIFERKERELADANERVKAGVLAKFGRDSYEYSLIGGVRKSEIGSYRPITYIPGGENGENGEPEEDPGGDNGEASGE